MRSPTLAVLLSACWIAVGQFWAGAALAQDIVVRSHGWAIHGELAYSPDFTHFDYVNPDAPKGGEFVQGAEGTFDSLNPFITKGNPAIGTNDIYDTLMVDAWDEPNSEYGLLAEWIEVEIDDDGIFTAVRFGLRPEARFHDGRPITADDIVWSFNTLREKGAPVYRFYYASVTEVVALSDRIVEFRLAPGDNREMPVILGQVPALPKHYWQDKDFTRTTLTPPLGSGPYKIGSVRAGQSITLERVADYWGKDLPVNIGHHNFASMRYEYFRDPTVMLEAFKAGDLDLRTENTSKFWATAYNVPAVDDGRILRKEFPHHRPAVIQGYVMNLRRPIFQDITVREAMSYLWDFEWVDRVITYNAYQRTDSYFENSEMEAQGLPGPKELEVLDPLRGQIPDRVFTQAYHAPVSDGSGINRDNQIKAMDLMKRAGWVVRDGILVNAETGQPFAVEILLSSESLTPHTQTLIRGIERLGGQATLRVVDAAQYRARLDSYDFDIVVGVWGQSFSPGNEQREFWGSAAAARPGSRNLPGISDPAIDTLIEDLIASPDRETLDARCRALDRVLQWNFFMIPMFHSKADRYAFWNRFGYPDTPPMHGTETDFWWVDAEKDQALKRRGRE